MISFICKFIGSMIRDCKKELCFVLVGMVLCLCLLISFADNLFSFRNGYGTVSDEEALKFNDNIICFAFADTEQLDEVVTRVSDIPDVYGVYLYGYVREGKIQCGTRLPLVEKDIVLTGKIPEQLSDGEIITSHDFSLGAEYAMEEDLDEGYASIEEDMENSFSKEYIGRGETVQLGEKEFVNVAQISDPEGHIVTVNDFFELYRESGQGEVMLTYVYEDGFTSGQKQAVEDAVAAVRQPERVWPGISAQGIEFSFFIECTRDVLIGLVIASLNSLFLYAYLLNKRIPVYTILKLQGLTNYRLRGMLLVEFLLVYLVACVVSVVAYGVYSVASGNLLRSTRQVCLYSFGSLLLVNLLLFLLLTWRLVRKPPFEMYQRR